MTTNLKRFALAALAVLSGCGQNELPQVSTVIIRTPKDARLKPLWAEDISGLQSLATRAQGLVTYNAAGEIVPALAESWVVTDDGLSYIFRIRQAVWPSEKKVTAAEVARALRSAMASIGQTGLNAAFADVADIVAMTDRVIEVRLRRPQTYFLQVLAHPQMGIIWKGQGTGPFIVAKKRDGSAVLRRRLSKLETAAFDETELERAKQFMVVDSPARALVRFRSGQSNLLLGGNFLSSPLLLNADVDDALVRRDPVVGLFGLLASDQSATLKRADARKALAMSIDRAAFVSRIGIKGWPVQESILPFAIDGTIAQAQPEWAGLNKDERRARARALLGSAGKSLRLTLAIPRGSGGRLAFAQLHSDFARVGVTLALATAGEPADLMFVDTVADFSAAGWFFARLSCGSGFACSAEADRNLVEARGTSEGQAHGRFLALADKAMTDAQVFIPIAPPLRWSIVGPQLAGYRENSMGFHNLAWIRTGNDR